MISRLNEDKWSKCRDIRLESLKNEPSAFSSSYDMEKNLSETEWRKRIKNSLFAISEGRIIGMIAVIYKENFGELNGLYVKKEFRKRGIGKELILSALSEIKEHKDFARLSVTRKNEHAIKLYKDIGFRIIQESKDRFEMEKKIQE